MAAPLIYVPRSFHPDGDARKEAILGAVGLADHAPADDLPLAGGIGPDGEGGTLFGWQAPGRSRLHYKASEQTWIPAAPKGDLLAGRYWVGVWNDSPPTEGDLRRPYRYGGKEFPLAGQSWLLPYPKELPHDLRFADDGTWKFVVQRRYHDYYVRCLGWIEQAGSESGCRFTVEDAIWVAVEALSINYRLTPELISHMRLLDDAAGSQQLVGKMFAAALGLEVEG